MKSFLKNKKHWILGAMALVFLWCAGSVYRGFLIHKEKDFYEFLVEGDTLTPATSFVNLEGEKKTFAEFGGKVVFLNFWAAWCGPCLKEMPSIYKLQNKFKERGLVVLGISMDEDPLGALPTLIKVAGSAPFSFVRGYEQIISQRFPIEGLPHTVIVDRSRVIRYSRPGERDWMDSESVALIEGLL